MNLSGNKQISYFGQVEVCINLIFTVRNDYDNESQKTSSVNKELFRGLYGISDSYDLVIVGGGLSGAVIAEQASKRSGLRSLVIDKRNHIGGNCYDFIDEHGIRVSFLKTLEYFNSFFKRINFIPC